MFADPEDPLPLALTNAHARNAVPEAVLAFPCALANLFFREKPLDLLTLRALSTTLVAIPGRHSGPQSQTRG
eukprot:9341655-Lingulodinium_polyedra.AAC.1